MTGIQMLFSGKTSQLVYSKQSVLIQDSEGMVGLQVYKKRLRSFCYSQVTMKHNDSFELCKKAMQHAAEELETLTVEI